MKRVLITGGAGFIGSVVAGTLAESGQYRIVVCDQFGSGDKWRNLSRHRIFEIISPTELMPWLAEHTSEISAILHFGASSSTTETNVDFILQHNFTLSRQLWLWATAQKVPFIYASSAATYGDGSSGFNDDIAKEYLSKLRPLNPYGWSKWLFDQHVSVALERGDATPPQWVGLRFFNVYGPNEYHKGEQKSVACNIFPHAEQGRPVHLFKSYNKNYPDGGQMRDFIYVKDCANIVAWLLENPHVSGIFNVGTGTARSFKDLAHAVFAGLGKPPAIAYYDMPEGLKSKYQYFTEAKMDRLRGAGYTAPFTSLEDGVKDYVQNYLMQADKYF
jgi:ADP-L-glycero-D-manno-heptose 6-epimerase